MNARFRQILNLALRPETIEGEAAAALAAARRMVVKEGLDTMLAPEIGVKEKERIVYRDVYRDSSIKNPYAQPKRSGELKVKTSRLHSTLEIAFALAQSHNVVLMITQATTADLKILGGTIIKMDIYGDINNIQAWFKAVSEALEHSNRKAKQGNNHTSQSQSSIRPKKEPGFWSRLFGAK